MPYLKLPRRDQYKHLQEYKDTSTPAEKKKFEDEQKASRRKIDKEKYPNDYVGRVMKEKAAQAIRNAGGRPDMSKNLGKYLHKAKSK